jgi:hypothetical protein
MKETISIRINTKQARASNATTNQRGVSLVPLLRPQGVTFAAKLTP